MLTMESEGPGEHPHPALQDDSTTTAAPPGRRLAKRVLVTVLPVEDDGDHPFYMGRDDGTRCVRRVATCGTGVDAFVLDLWTRERMVVVRESSPAVDFLVQVAEAWRTSSTRVPQHHHSGRGNRVAPETVLLPESGDGDMDLEGNAKAKEEDDDTTNVDDDDDDEEKTVREDMVRHRHAAFRVLSHEKAAKMGLISTWHSADSSSSSGAASSADDDDDDDYTNDIERAGGDAQLLSPPDHGAALGWEFDNASGLAASREITDALAYPVQKFMNWMGGLPPPDPPQPRHTYDPTLRAKLGIPPTADPSGRETEGENGPNAVVATRIEPGVLLPTMENHVADKKDAADVPLEPPHLYETLLMDARTRWVRMTVDEYVHWEAVARGPLRNRTLLGVIDHFVNNSTIAHTTSGTSQPGEPPMGNDLCQFIAGGPMVVNSPPIDARAARRLAVACNMREPSIAAISAAHDKVMGAVRDILILAEGDSDLPHAIAGLRTAANRYHMCLNTVLSGDYYMLPPLNSNPHDRGPAKMVHFHTPAHRPSHNDGKKGKEKVVDDDDTSGVSVVAAV